MLAIADAMASHAGLAGPLFSVDEHGGWLAVAAGLSRRVAEIRGVVVSRVRNNGPAFERFAVVRCRKRCGSLSVLQSRQGKKAKPSGLAARRRGLETKRVAGCTA
jgi:hypothetical protein